MLVLSGALLAGCGGSDPADRGVADATDTNTYTNNTYRASHGYYHAPHHAWFPMPFGHFMPGRGYLESNWILGVLGRELLLWGASQSRMPAFKRFSQVTVQDVDPHLQ